jgi:3-oxoacyl-[acyl-carrier protein] reductase
MLLSGKTALVTGASRGLGRAICDVLAREGADVAFNYSQDDAAAAQTTALIEAHGRRAWPFKVSVLDAVGLRAMIATLEAQTPGLDILINNAGVAQVVPLALMEESDWDHVMDTNIKGAFLTTRAAMRGMIRRRQGKILNMSSLAGVKMMQAPIHYCTSKAAMRGFTEALAKELGRYNITSNCLAPGVLDEGVGDNLPPKHLAQYLAHCAIGRVGTCAEVAEVVAFLVSDRNSYMNGATILLDGGV